MREFKFFNNNDFYSCPSEDEIADAINVGRSCFMAGHSIEYNPYLRPALFNAFQEGWVLEESYQSLRDSIRANNETI